MIPRMAKGFPEKGMPPHSGLQLQKWARAAVTKSISWFQVKFRLATVFKGSELQRHPGRLRQGARHRIRPARH